jgi:hypothetical protein
LRERAHIGDLIQEERPGVRNFEFPPVRPQRSRKGASLVTEELAFEERVTHGRGVERDEWSFGARRRIMDGVGEQSFAGTSPAKDEHRCVAPGREVGQLETASHDHVSRGQLVESQVSDRAHHWS